jgi:hypothetical protein
LSIAPKAATPHTMDSRKRRRIVDDEEDDDSEARNDVDRPIIDVEEDDDDSEDEYDDDDGDYDENEDDDDEADEVDDKSSYPPGINDSLAFSKKGGEKRSGSIVVNVEQGCNLPPPPSTHQGRSRSRSGSNEATVEWGSKAPPPSQEGKKRRGSNVASVVRGCKRSPRRGTNPQQNQRNKRGKKNKGKRVGILHPPPLMAVLSVVIQVQTKLVPMNLPHLFLEMSDLKHFPKMTLTMNICAHVAGQSIPLVIVIYKIHHFLFSSAHIDFAESASIIWGGARIVP